jgi:hypothetical protein
LRRFPQFHFPEEGGQNADPQRSQQWKSFALERMRGREEQKNEGQKSRKEGEKKGGANHRIAQKVSDYSSKDQKPQKGRGRIEKESFKKVSKMEGITPGICLNGSR